MPSIDLDCDKILNLYKTVFNETSCVTPLPGAGSDRRYFRLYSLSSPSAIATVGNDLRENKAFVALARAFRDAGINVPDVFVADNDCSSYLQQDLGDVQLLSLLATPERMCYARQAMEDLVKLQTVDENIWGAKVCSPPFSMRQAMWDLNYFKYEFLKPCSLLFDEDLLEDDFERLVSMLVNIDSRIWGFMYRDFQSRNILVDDGRLWFIDFQGGRKGPLLYDAVSFLWQAKACFTEEERSELLDVYAVALSRKRGIPAKDILKDVGLFALFRTLQVLGAYGFRGLVEKKAHFIESIPGALANLGALVAQGVLDEFPELKRVCQRATCSRFSKKEAESGLTVKVFSFSYKKGYPEDLSGNGGGFMFDCRGMHNPGKYDRYKSLTGLDADVVAFLEEQGEVQGFVKRALEIVAPSVERYQKRGFSGLQIGFGCTGGRHRSVYCAQALAEALSKKYPSVKILLFHREQEISRTYNEKIK